METIDISTKDLFTTHHVTKVLDIPMQRLRVWLLNGYIAPAIPSGGQGQKAFFLKEDLYVIALFKKLLEKGFKRELASKYCNSMKGINTPLGFANYLTIWTTEIDGKFVMGSHLLAGSEKFRVDILPNMVNIWPGDDQKLVKAVDVDWNDIYIINLTKIMRRVDTALNEVE